MESKREEPQIEQEKLKKLQFRVFNLEHNNYSTKALNGGQMVDKIIKLITQEVENDN